MLVLLRESVGPTFCFGAPLNRLAGGREKSREGKFICSAASEEKKILPTGRYPDQTIPIYGAELHAKCSKYFVLRLCLSKVSQNCPRTAIETIWKSASHGRIRFSRSSVESLIRIKHDATSW
jgi:hypothetical protein